MHFYHYFDVISQYMTLRWVLSRVRLWHVISGAGTADPSRAPEFLLIYNGIHVVQYVAYSDISGIHVAQTVVTDCSVLRYMWFSCYSVYNSLLKSSGIHVDQSLVYLEISGIHFAQSVVYSDVGNILVIQSIVYLRYMYPWHSCCSISS